MILSILGRQPGPLGITERWTAFFGLSGPMRFITIGELSPCRRQSLDWSETLSTWIPESDAEKGKRLHPRLGQPTKCFHLTAQPTLSTNMRPIYKIRMML